MQSLIEQRDNPLETKFEIHFSDKPEKINQ
jgi:hypothetical protein